MSWASQRRFGYAVGTALLLLLLAGGAVFWASYERPTCFDAKQSGDELGVDCGGSCAQLCAFEVAPLKILWSRIFEVSPGRYNAVAYVENPNSYAGVGEMPYIFRVMDRGSNIIAERKGSSFITSNGVSPIFESDIRLSESSPARVFFEFTEEPRWHRAQGPGQTLSVKNTRLLDTATRPRLDATLVNSSLDEYKDVEVVGVVFTSDGNAVAVSRTVIDVLSGNSEVPLVFTWPRPFEKRLESCLVPADVMLLLDTSGSMSELGASPPQPLTDAKNAAVSFVNKLNVDDRGGVVAFASGGTLKQGLSGSHDVTRKVVEAISILPQEEKGYTNIVAGLVMGREELLKNARDESYSQVMILLTDGRANAPSEDSAESMALLDAAESKRQDISIYTIGLGGNVNHEFLKQIATSPAHYFRAGTGDELESIYGEISIAICERGPAVIDIQPRVRESLYLP